MPSRRRPWRGAVRFPNADSLRFVHGLDGTAGNRWHQRGRRVERAEQRLADGGARAPAAVERPLGVIEEALECAPDHGENERLLGSEIEVQRALREPEAAGDLMEVDDSVRIRLHDAFGCREDGITPLQLALRARARWYLPNRLSR